MERLRGRGGRGPERWTHEAEMTFETYKDPRRRVAEGKKPRQEMKGGRKDCSVD